MNGLEDQLVERPLIDYFKQIGYEHEYGPDIAPGTERAERRDYREVILADRLRRSLRRLNPDLDEAVLEEAVKTLSGFSHPNAIIANKETWRMLTDGVKVEVKQEGGERRGRLARVFDFDAPLNNEFLVVNQFTIQGPEHVRRPDLVVFVNGLPLAVFELKSPTSARESLRDAYAQLLAYKSDIPELFRYNQALCVSDLVEAKHGTISSTWEWFAEWKGIEREDERHEHGRELEVLVRGLFEKHRLLDVVRNYIVFEADSEREASTYTKKMCKYHQYYGVDRAVRSAVEAVAGRSRKMGVFWHTQGSGKSLSMVFFANKARLHPELRNPTFVFLTDRRDLDDQLYKTFKRTSYPTAKQAESIPDLQEKLKGAGGELLFTTIQKFQEKGSYPMLTERDNILVIADEAHRSEYAMLAANARLAMPNASFMGITGTPISKESRDTRAVFGEYVSMYPINRAVEDGATVPIYYEGRLAPLHLADQFIDEKFDEITEGHEEEVKGTLRRKWATLKEAVMSPDRMRKVAEDIVAHFNGRGLEGKAMVVTVSREAAVMMYELLKAMPDAPECAAVVSGPEDFEGRLQEETDPSKLERRFKDPSDPLKLAIVCDMWLTGFDVPPLHTLYLDKPLRNHGLMQAIARVNRIWKDKPAGLVVDYIGVADDLKRALSLYTSDVHKEAMLPFDEIVGKMRESHDVVKNQLNGVPYGSWKDKKEGFERAELFIAGMNAVITDKKTGLPDDEKKRRFLQEARKLFKLFGLVMPQKEAVEIRDDVMFFRIIYKHIVRSMLFEHETYELDIDSAVKELVSKSFSAGKVIDVFEMAGKGRPDVSILSEEFLAEVRGLKHKNIAVEIMRKILRDSLSDRKGKNLLKYELLSELLERIIEEYKNHVIAATEALQKLIELAQDIRSVGSEGKKTGLSEEESPFFDILTIGTVLDEEQAKKIAKEIVKNTKGHLTVDWAANEIISSRIRADIRLLLLRNGYLEGVDEMVDDLFRQAVALYGDFEGMET